MIINEDNHKIATDFIHQYIQIAARFGSFVEELGLFQGKTGLSLLLYKYGRIFGDRETEKYADLLIDEIISELRASKPLSVENGVAGIGLGLLYLSENDYVEVDHESFFKQFDQYLISLWYEDFSLNRFQIFIGIYFLKRMQLQQNRSDVLVRTIQKITVMLNKEIVKLVDSYSEEGAKKNSDKMIHSLLYFSLRCLDYGIETRVTSKNIELLTSFFDQTNNTFHADHYISLLLLSHIDNDFTRIEQFLEESTTRFTLNDHTKFSIYRILYGNALDTNTNYTLGKNISSLIESSELPKELIGNTCLETLSLTYGATRLCWALLDTTFLQTI